MKLSDLGEFGLIAQIRERFPAPDGTTGIGDDCAIMPQHGGRDTLVSTDMLVEGTHFLRDDIPPYSLGWKSAAVNLSDIAAMGGQPTGTFLSLALPADLDAGWVEEFLRGYREISAQFRTPLLGGDTTASPDRICINVAVLGECPTGMARTRSNARPGDLVCVTGTLGDSAAGLKAILEGVEREADVQALIDRHYRPLPRVEEGRQLAATPGVHAMMDISDGIGSDLQHILEASYNQESGTKSSGGDRVPLQGHFRAERGFFFCPGSGSPGDPDKSLPISDVLRRVCDKYGWDATQLAVSGGEDYELLFTVDPAAEARLTVPHTVIGRITGSPVKPGMTRWSSFAAPSPSFADLIGESGYDAFKKR